MRKLFNIPAERETRLWNKYMSNTYEQLSKLDSTVQDAGLYQGQVGGPDRPPRQRHPGCGQQKWAGLPGPHTGPPHTGASDRAPE